MTRQQKIYYDAIKAFIQKNGFSPSYDELAKIVGVASLASVHAMVGRLIREGYLVKGRSGSRNLAVVTGKLYGFNSCTRNHVLIFFQEAVCPLCDEIQKRLPPREVQVSSV